MAKITLYGTQWCPFCQRTEHEQLLQCKGVTELTKVEIDRDPALREAMVARTGRRTVSQMFIGETHVGGYDDLSVMDRDGRLDGLFRQPIGALSCRCRPAGNAAGSGLSGSGCNAATDRRNRTSLGKFRRSAGATNYIPALGRMACRSGYGEAHQGIAELSTVDPCFPESALILRSQLDVEVIRLNAGTSDFVAHLSQGARLGHALEETSRVHSKFDLTNTLGLLLRTQAISAIEAH